MIKNQSANAGDVRDLSLIPGSGRSPGGGHGNPRQYSCLENPMDRGAWWATVHRTAKSWTRLKHLSTYPQDTGNMQDSELEAMDDIRADGQAQNSGIGERCLQLWGFGR